MKLFFGDKQLNENSILKCTEANQMKKNSAVEIARDIITTKAHAFVEPNGAGEHLKILAQAVIDAHNELKAIEDSVLESSVRTRDWIKEYAGEE